MMTFEEALKTLQKELNVTPEEFTLKPGGTGTLIIRKSSKITLKRIIELADAMGMDVKMQFIPKVN